MNEIMPYMNERVENGTAAFIVHAGDFVGGGGLAENARCNEYVSRKLKFFVSLFVLMHKNSHSLLPSQMFQSRYDVFSTGANFMIVPGDVSFNSYKCIHIIAHELIHLIQLIFFLSLCPLLRMIGMNVMTMTLTVTQVH